MGNLIFTVKDGIKFNINFIEADGFRVDEIQKTVLEINPHGFFVEGRKVTSDTEIYDKFKEWLNKAWN